MGSGCLATRRRRGQRPCVLAVGAFEGERLGGEGTIAPQPCEPRHGVFNTRTLTFGDPPQRRWLVRRRDEPLAAAAEKGGVHGVVDVASKVCDGTPDGQIEQHARVVQHADSCRVAARGREASEAPWRAVAQLVDPVDLVAHVGHPRVVERIAHPGKIGLGQGSCHRSDAYSRGPSVHLRALGARRDHPRDHLGQLIGRQIERPGADRATRDLDRDRNTRVRVGHDPAQPAQ